MANVICLVFAFVVGYISALCGSKVMVAVSAALCGIMMYQIFKDDD